MTDMYDECGQENTCYHRLFESGVDLKKEKFSVNNGGKKEEYAIINIRDWDSDLIEHRLVDEISLEIGRLVRLKKNMRVLVVALGNRHISADSLGSSVLKYVIPSGNGFLQCAKAKIMTISTNVFSLSGIEAYDLVKSLTTNIKCDLVVAIDSLCAKSYHRLGKSFQLCNGGISPGLGLGNDRKEISVGTLGLPVLVIGVPLVMYARDMCEDIEDDFVVTVKDIESVVKKSGRVIGYAIDKAFLGLSLEESEELCRQ